MTPLPNSDTGIDFTNPKGKYVYINGYEILVTRDAGAGSHTGEGLLYYPYLKTRIPVTWSGASIKKATDGDYGCLSPEVIAIGSQNGVVAADYRQQVIDLLTSGPHAYSGNLKGALAELKKVVADLNAGRTIDPAYAKSVIDAAQKGIEEWKTTVSKYFTEGNAPLPPEVQQILNSIEAIKTSLNAPKDCLAANIPPASPSGSKKAILFSLKFEVCTLSAEQKSVLEGALNGINENVAAIEKLLLIATKSPIGNWFTVGYQYFMPHNGIVRTYFNTLKLNGAPFGIEINGIDYYWDGISQYKKDTSWTSTGIPAFSPDVAPIIATSAPDIYYYYVYFPNGDCAYEKRTTDGTVQSSVSFDGCKSISSNSAKKPKNENVQCPVTPTTIEPTAFVDVFLHSERYIQCLTSLSIENRKILLNKILGSWATTDCLQNIDDPTIRIGNCYEPLCRNIILSTPPSQQKEILDYLKAQGLLDKIFKHLQLGTFDIVLKTLSDWIHQEYPKPSLLLSDYIYEDGSKTGVIDRTKSKYIRFTKNSVSASFANGKVTLHHDKECELIDRFCYETVPATDFTIDDPYSYVLVYFENDAGNFKKGNYYTIPAIEAHLIFNKDRRDLYITTGKIALEVGLLALGVGEFQAAYKAWQVGRGVYATYLATKATLDLGMGITDIYIQNELAEKWKREGQEAKLAKWNEINKWYIAVSFSVSVLDVAITKLGIGKTIDDETELNRLYDELTGVKGFVNRLESLNLTNLKREFQALDNASQAKFIDDFTVASDATLLKLEAKLKEDINLVTYWKNAGTAIKNNQYVKVEYDLWDNAKSKIISRNDPIEVKILNAIETSPLPNGQQKVMAGAYSSELPAGSGVSIKYNTSGFDVKTLQPELQYKIEYIQMIKDDFDAKGKLYTTLYTGVPADKMLTADIAGIHAEVLAINDVIIQLKAINKFSDLSDIKVLVKGKVNSVRGYENMCRCPHCFHITNGVNTINKP